jgi:adenine/guanine phosphoribosyltransferase-like PRPP-binding protein
MDPVRTHDFPLASLSAEQRLIAPAHFTEATTAYWQQIVAPTSATQADPPWRFDYPARLPDGRVLMLPIRQLASAPGHAVASLLLNQAALGVVDDLGTLLASQLKNLGADAVVGLPTLGLTLASVVAGKLGHGRYLPLGYSRKFWYDEALSTPVSSITTPTPGKRIYLDPHLLPLVRGQRLILIDDTVSSGTTLCAVWDLIESLGAEVLACGVAMRQGRKWAEKIGPQRTARVFGVFDSPLLQAVPDGWMLRS